MPENSNGNQAARAVAALEAALPAAEAGVSGAFAALLRDRLPGLLALTTKKVNIDHLKADNASLRDLDIDKITLGQATIGNITLSDVDASLDGAQAFLQRVRMVMELKFTFKWEVDLGFWSESGTENLGSMHIPVDVGNVDVPSLADIDLKIPSVQVPGAEAAISPINNLDLGGAALHKVAADDTSLPAAGFNLPGLGVGGASVENIDVPETQTRKVAVDRFAPNNPVTIPGATITDLDIPAAKVDDIATGGFALSAHAQKRCLGVDLGILDVDICVEPIAHMDIESMVIRDAALSVAAKKLQVQDITFPLEVRGIRMADLSLATVKVDKVSLG